MQEASHEPENSSCDTENRKHRQSNEEKHQAKHNCAHRKTKLPFPVWPENLPQRGAEYISRARCLENNMGASHIILVWCLIGMSVRCLLNCDAIVIRALPVRHHTHPRVLLRAARFACIIFCKIISHFTASCLFKVLMVFYNIGIKFKGVLLDAFTILN